MWVTGGSPGSPTCQSDDLYTVAARVPAKVLARAQEWPWSRIGELAIETQFLYTPSDNV
jgi:hypothetical protein